MYNKALNEWSLGKLVGENKTNCSHWDHKPKSSYEGRTVFNLITQFDLKYKEITLALALQVFQNKQKINCNNLEIN